MTIDEYVQAVLRHLPRALVDRERVESDLRAHLADRVAAGESTAEAIQRMGTADEVAGELLRTMPLRPASPIRRIAAFLIDVAVAVVPMMLFGLMMFVPMLTLTDAADILTSGIFVTLFTIGLLMAVAVPALSVVYFPVLEKLFGQTLGKWLLGIYVVRDNGAALRWRDAIIRRIPFFFEFFWLDALFALFTARHQRAFDKVAGTLVVTRMQSAHPVPAAQPV